MFEPIAAADGTRFQLEAEGIRAQGGCVSYFLGSRNLSAVVAFYDAVVAHVQQDTRARMAKSGTPGEWSDELWRDAVRVAGLATVRGKLLRGDPLKGGLNYSNEEDVRRALALHFTGLALPQTQVDRLMAFFLNRPEATVRAMREADEFRDTRL